MTKFFMNFDEKFLVRKKSLERTLSEIISHNNKGCLYKPSFVEVECVFTETFEIGYILKYCNVFLLLIKTKFLKTF